MLEKILEILNDVTTEEVNAETELVNSGIIDSFILVNLVISLESEFDIEIPIELIVAENFSSANRISDLIANCK